MAIRIVQGNQTPIVCIPGAGSSIISFNNFLNSLSTNYSLYGLQPRGLDFSSDEMPHGSVESAAAYNLNAINKLTSGGGIHLIGHSYGGLVAFEMAIRLQAQGRTVASLTLIDSDNPAKEDSQVREITEQEIFKSFIHAIEMTFEKPLNMDKCLLEPEIGQKLRHLHDALVKGGSMHARSHPDTLNGSFFAFSAALRTIYKPVSTYDGKVRLVLVRDPLLTQDENVMRQKTYEHEWRQWASELEVWHGPGHHYSILRAPYVSALSQWWRTGIKPIYA